MPETNQTNRCRPSSAISPRVLILLAAVVGFFWTRVDAADSVTINVGNEPKQEFLGFGSHEEPYHPWLTEVAREQMTQVLWGDMPLTLYRFYRVLLPGWSNKLIVDKFKRGIIRKKRIVNDWAAANGRPQDTLKFLFNPAGIVTDPLMWGELIASCIDTLEKACGIVIDYTGIGNEPNQQPGHDTWAAPIPSASIPGVIKGVRAKLDEYGLEHVKIIAPGCSNVDGWLWQTTDAIIADKDALESLYAWEYHAYNMSITNAMSRHMSYQGTPNQAKPIFQTESSLPEGDWEDADSMAAAQLSCRFLADMNFGVVYWNHWLDARFLRPRSWAGSGPGNALFSYMYQTSQLRPALKVWYFRQLGRTFPPGTVFRKSETNLHEITGRSEDRYMEYTHGLKIPLSAAAGIRSDGTWAMACVNHTDIRFRDYGTSYYERKDYDVTFSIPELAGTSKQFQVMRCNNSTRNIMEEPVTMVDGKLTVNIQHADLVSIAETIDTNFVPMPDQNFEVVGGSVDDCGSGIVIALIPPIGFAASSRVRRRRKNRKLAGSTN